MWHFGFFLFCFSSKPCITSSVLFTFKPVFRILLMLYDRSNCFSAFWFSVKWWTWLPFHPLSQPKQPKPNQLFTHSWLHSGIIFQIMKLQCRVIKRLGWCQRVDYRAAWRKELDLLLITFSWGSSPLAALPWHCWVVKLNSAAQSHEWFEWVTGALFYCFWWI